MSRLRSAYRNSARAVALLLATVMFAGVTGLGHTAWGDPACDPIPIHHDHNAHRIHGGSLPAAPDSDHCLLCHSLRTLGTGLTVTNTPFAVAVEAGVVRVADVVLTGRILDPHAPSRAPPVVLL
jgi:hypothetical protein